MYLTGNSNLVLNIDTAGFTEGFLTDPDSRIYLNQTQWDDAVLDTSYRWFFDADTGPLCARPAP